MCHTAAPKRLKEQRVFDKVFDLLYGDEYFNLSDCLF